MVLPPISLLCIQDIFHWKTIFLELITFFELLIAQKRFIFEHSYVSYGKRQKSCTFIII